MAVDESLKKLDKIFDQNVEITGTLTVGGNTVLTSYTETDPIFSASAAAVITSTNISNWNTAYGWGNHADAGYLTSSSTINADTVDGYHASNLWRSDGATWNPSANVILNQSANSQEWSFDIIRNGYSGGYWQVWDSSNSTMLKVDAVNGKVYAPYNFVGNLEGNASSASSVSWSNVSGKPSTFPPSGHDHDRAFITDTRGAQRAPSYYDDRYVQWDFQNNADTSAGGDSWQVLQTISPWTAYDNSHRQQQLVFTGTGGIKFRYATSDSAWAGWQTIWTSGNDGAGSGLDADLLDGIGGDGYLRSNATDTVSGVVTFSTAPRITARNTDSGGSAVYFGAGTRLNEYMSNVGLELHSGNDEPITIYFKSGVNAPSDCAYITYDPDYNNSGENGALVLGSENDGTGSSDYIRLQARTVVDSNAHSSDNTEIMEWLQQGTQYALLNTDYFRHNSDIRTPIFYDSNDTNYYVDAGSTGTSIKVRGTIENPSIWINDGDNYNGYNENIRLFNPANGVSVIAFAASGTSGTPTSSILGYPDRHEVRRGTNWETRTYDGYQVARGSYRAPTFYDSNDTAYFVNPNGRSRLAEIDYGNSSYYFRSGDWGWRHQTPSGWIQFGPANTGHAHIYTDRSNFYFNVDTNAATTYARSSSRAPIFYDSDNTGYFLNPASDSNLNGNLNLASGYITINKGHSDTRVQLLYDNGTAGQNAQLLLWASEPGITYYGVGFGANIDFRGQYYGRRTSALSYGVYMRMDPNNGNTYFNTTTSAPSSNGGQGGVRFQIDPSGNTYSFGSSRAPIFYDYNNTAYYCNPNGQSIFNNGSGYETLVLEGEYPQLTIRRTSIPDASIHFDAGYAKKWNVGPGAGGAEEDEFGFAIYSAPRGTHYGTPMRINAETQNVMIGDADHPAFKLDVRGQIRATSDIRGTIFYDEDNTGYYCNPSSTSRLARADFGLGGTSGNGGVAIGLGDGSLHFRSMTDYNHKMWYYDGLNFSTNPSHGHIRFWADSSQRNNSTGGSTLIFDADCQNSITTAHGTFKCTGDILAYSSDARLKENVRLIENPLDKLKNIRGVIYDWKDVIDEYDFRPRNRKDDVGVIAQEVEAVLPQVVTLAPFDTEMDDEKEIPISKSGENYKTVQYEKLVPLLIEAVKELSNKVEDLENQLKQKS